MTYFSLTWKFHYTSFVYRHIILDHLYTMIIHITYSLTKPSCPCPVYTPPFSNNTWKHVFCLLVFCTAAPTVSVIGRWKYLKLRFWWAESMLSELSFWTTSVRTYYRHPVLVPALYSKLFTYRRKLEPKYKWFYTWDPQLARGMASTYVWNSYRLYENWHTYPLKWSPDYNFTTFKRIEYTCFF